MVENELNISAIIIAGGKGTRLSQYTNEVPKPMIKLAGKTVLEYQIEMLKRNGINDIIITVGHLKEKIMDYFEDGHSFGCNISYIEENEPLGTCGAFFWLKDKVADCTIVLLGDIILDIDIRRFIEFHKAKKGMITIITHPNTHPYDSDIVDCDNNACVTRIHLKSNERPKNLFNNVNAGVYIMEHTVFSFFDKPEKKDLEKDLIAHFAAKRQVFAYKTTEYLKDMGTVDRLAEVEAHIRSGLTSKMSLRTPQRCVFIDRDGTINKLNGLVNSPEMFELEFLVPQALRKLTDAGFLCIIITNQPVIARNLCDFDMLDDIHKKMDTVLGKNGAFVHDIFVCPHHPDAGYPEERKEYKVKCDCRKPNIGLVSQAVNKYNIDLEHSFFIGDTTVDIQTGINAGVKTVLLLTGEKGQDKKYHVIPDVICSNMLEAAEWILSSDIKNNVEVGI